MGNEASRLNPGEVLTKNVDKRSARKHHKESFQLAIRDWQEKKAASPYTLPTQDGEDQESRNNPSEIPVVEIDFSPSSPPPPPAESPKSPGRGRKERSKQSKELGKNLGKNSSDGSSKEGGHHKHLQSLKQRSQRAVKGRSISSASQDSQPPPPPPSVPRHASPKGDKARRKAVAGMGKKSGVPASPPALGEEESRVCAWFESLCKRDAKRAHAFLRRLETVYDDSSTNKKTNEKGRASAHEQLTTKRQKAASLAISTSHMGGSSIRSKSQPSRANTVKSNVGTKPATVTAKSAAARASRKKQEADVAELERLNFRNPLEPKRLAVSVRKRPMFSHEREEDFDVVDASGVLGDQSIVVFDTRMNADMRRMKMTPNVYTFDQVFDEGVSNKKVFSAAAEDLVDHALSGHFASAFMFGATGSGKTHTMTGIVDLAAAKIFKRVERKLAQGTKASVTLAMFELYGSKCRDLLSPAAQARLSACDDSKDSQAEDSFMSSSSSNHSEDGKRSSDISSGDRDNGHFRLLEGNDGALLFDGLTEKECLSEAVFLGDVDQGQRARVTTETGVHDQSSRSHAFYRIQIQCGSKQGELLLVDLAGSERNKDSFNHDHALQVECAEINTSLMALKNCFRAHAAGDSFIPFRSSLLTRILKQGLVDPNAKAAIIATVAPSSSDTEHTLSTLSNVSAMLSSDSDSTGAGTGKGPGSTKNPSRIAGKQSAVHHCKLTSQEIKSIASLQASKAYEQARMENPKRWTPQQLQEWWRKHAPANIDPPPNVSGEMVARWPQNRFVQFCINAVSEKAPTPSASTSSSSPRSSRAVGSPARKKKIGTNSSPSGRRSSSKAEKMSKPSPSHKQAMMDTSFAQRKGEELYHLFREEILRLSKHQQRRAQANRF